MARREPHPTQALEGSVMGDPSPIAPACLAQADARVVPITRRGAPAPQHHTRAGGARLTRRVGGVHA